MKIQMRKPGDIRPYKNNPRSNEAAIAVVAESLKNYGFRQPIVVDIDGVIIAGDTRWRAAQQLGLAKVPVHVAKDLTADQVRAYRIADNATAEHSEWDMTLLKVELEQLEGAGFDTTSLGMDAELLECLMSGPAQPAERPTGGEPGQGAYREQYGVIVVCRDAAHQQQTYEALLAGGHECKVVCT